MAGQVDLHAGQAVGAEHGSVRIDGDRLTVSAGAGTDAFLSPDGTTTIDRLPGLRLALPEGPAALSVHVVPSFAATFDAGALMLRTDRGTWAKLAFELSPQGRKTAVSVVTRTSSDDANGPDFDSDGLHLRVYRDDGLTAFHISTDGVFWSLLRLFDLPGETATIDLIAQSPMGQGAVATFSGVRLARGAIEDLRDGC